MNCHEFRRQSARFSAEVQFDTPGSPFAIHGESCAECRGWAQRELELDTLILDWNSQPSTVNLENQILAAWHAESAARQSVSPQPGRTSAPRPPFPVSTRRLISLVGALAATLVLALPQLTIERSTSPFPAEITGLISPEIAPVEALVNSVQNAVDQLASASPPPLSLSASTTLLPDWNAGTLPLPVNSNSTSLSEWTEISQALEPL